MASAEDVLKLLAGRIARVMVVDVGAVTAETRFDEDLHADSLDLVEVIEGVERDLRARGERSALSNQELVGLRTVGEVSARIAETTTPAGEAGGR